MIDGDYARTMAAYNRWQNASLYGTASKLSDAQRREDRGAFFGSVHGTLSHLLWADRLWLSRFTGHGGPKAKSIAQSVHECDDWEELSREREAQDAEITAWAAALPAEPITGELSWFSGATNRQVSKPLWLLVTHFFNHQTHHRGQVHAMLTAMGQRPEATDLPFMPES